MLEPAVKSKMPPAQTSEPEEIRPTFMSWALIGQDFPPKAIVIETVVEQAASKRRVNGVGVVDRCKDKRTESVKASKVAVELHGAGNLSIDRRNSGGRAADEGCAGVDGGDVSRWQGDTLSIDGDGYNEGTCVRKTTAQRRGSAYR